MRSREAEAFENGTFYRSEGKPISYRPLEKQFGVGLAIALLGYAFLGKGFAYLHIFVGFPLYVGEIVLGVGFLAAVLRPRVCTGAFLSMPLALFPCFFAWGVIRTLPYLGEYGTDAVRDSAIYYYGLFMPLTYAAVRGRPQLDRIASTYGKIAAVYVVWVPVAYVAFFMFRSWLPHAPGTDVPLIWFKGGDVSVHLAGAMAFALLAFVPSKGRSTFWYFLPALLVMCVMNRGGFLALACSLATAVVLGRKNKLWKLLAAGLVVMLFVLMVDFRITAPGGKEVSVDNALRSVQSIFADGDYRQGTKRWRLTWWSRIVDETLFGRYFWRGRGFGANLTEVHEIPAGASGCVRPLRSPHSSHMTVLARMGVPGLVLWLLLQGSLAWHFHRGWRRAKETSDRFRQGVLAWAICFWVAFVVNSSFDVYFEGPQGAIWFWSVMGLALAACEMKPVPAD